MTRPLTKISRRSDWMLAQLPVGMLEDDFFVRFVSIFQEVGAGLLADADNVENLLEVTVTPPAFVRYLGSWTGAPALDASLPETVQRDVVRSWARMLAWRGTRRGLQEFLHLIVGDGAQVVDSGGVIRPLDSVEGPPWVHVTVPSTGWMSESDFAELVRDEVPAHVYLELYVGERRILPAEPTTSSGALPGAPAAGQAAPHQGTPLHGGPSPEEPGVTG